MGKLKQILTVSYANMLLLLASPVMAADTGAFSKTTSLLEKIIDWLSGTFAVTVLTLVIIVFGYLTWANRIDKKWGISIVAGSILIGSAAQIAALFLE